MPTTCLDRPAIKDTLKGLEHAIGNTPLLAIDFLYRGEKRVIYAKSEQLNMTGSIKDRMALYILKQAYEREQLSPGDTIVEATSGNTGISFAALGRALGHSVIVYMPDWMSRERVDLIRSFGAKVVPVTKEQGGFLGSIAMAEQLAQTDDHVFVPRQFANVANVRAHELTTGPEIWWQLQFCSRNLDAFVAGVGTGGTIMGVSRYLRTQRRDIKVFPIEPAESPTLSTGHKVGKHRIQGISDEFIPEIVELSELNGVIPVHDGDAIIMAQKLARELGLGVGISSGANLVGAIKAQSMLGAHSVVATVLPDDNKKYLSTCLLQNEERRSDYVSSEVELLGFTAHKRVCHTCCDLYDCTQHLTFQHITAPANDPLKL